LAEGSTCLIVFAGWRQCAYMGGHVVATWQHGRAHWCHLANMTEPSVCGGDAVLCQITLTTSYVLPVL